MTTLDAAKIAAASLTAYALGTLCAQRTFPSNYDGAHAFYIKPELPDVRCAIGAGLTEEQAKAAEDRPAGIGYSVVSLMDAGILPPAATALDAEDLNLLQQLHDRWGQSARPANGTRGYGIPATNTAPEIMFVKFASALANGTLGDQLRTDARNSL